MSQKAAIFDRIVELTANKATSDFSKTDLVEYIKVHPETVISNNRRIAKKLVGNLVFVNPRAKGDGTASMKARIHKTLGELVDAGKLLIDRERFRVIGTEKKVRFSPQPPEVIAPRPGWSGKRTLPVVTPTSFQSLPMEELDIEIVNKKAKTQEDVARESVTQEDVAQEANINMLFDSVDNEVAVKRAQTIDQLSQVNKQIVATQEAMQRYLCTALNREKQEHVKLKFMAKDFVTRNKDLLEHEGDEVRAMRDLVRQYEEALVEQEKGAMYNREASRARMKWDRLQKSSLRGIVVKLRRDQYTLGASIYRRITEHSTDAVDRLAAMKSHLAYLQQCQATLVQQL